MQAANYGLQTSDCSCPQCASCSVDPQRHSCSCRHLLTLITNSTRTLKIRLEISICHFILDLFRETKVKCVSKGFIILLGFSCQSADPDSMIEKTVAPLPELTKGTCCLLIYDGLYRYLSEYSRELDYESQMGECLSHSAVTHL